MLTKSTEYMPAAMLIQHSSQNPGAMETRSLLLLSMTQDITVVRSKLEDLPLSKAMLMNACLPVGSVEYVRQAAKTLGVSAPGDLSYPSSLRPYMHRQVECLDKDSLSAIKSSCFIKPAEDIKTFSGFIWAPTVAPDQTDYVAEQRSVLAALPGSAAIWVSTCVRWQSEWRYYVLNNEIVGAARYDDGDDHLPSPDLPAVHAMVHDFAEQAPIAYALDVGVLDNGQTALVEVNDAWALGLYRGTLNDLRYLQMLWLRWQQILGVPIDMDTIYP